MLNVLTLQEALESARKRFVPVRRTESVPIGRALWRRTADEITAEEFVPDFDRSSVDGYAVRASDTFGCTEAIPAILPIQREILMGEGADFTLKPGCCASIPTGGAVPSGADSVVMIEYTEEYGDGTIGISKSAAPGQNMIYRGDDVRPGKTVIRKNRVLSPQDIGALAALGIDHVAVAVPLTVGILSTGDELVPPEEKPGPGQIRDVNSLLLDSMFRDAGFRTIRYGIIRDEEELLKTAVAEALKECDAVVLSGGSSVGIRDAAGRVIESFGPLLFHGLAMKPGKPTILGGSGNQPVFGLPGHPVAVFFAARLLVIPLLAYLEGRTQQEKTVSARLTENVSANHGRAFYCACRLKQDRGELFAEPIRAKSGLITSLTEADGYFCIERDCEGLPAGVEIPIVTIRGVE